MKILKKAKTSSRLVVMGLGLMGGLLVAMPPNARAATYTYTPTNSATETWASGANWSAVPASASDTILTFMGVNSNVLPNSTANFNNNDVANPFSLNVLNLRGTGPASGVGIISIGGSAIRFVSTGSSNPVVNLNAVAGTAGLNYSNTVPITLGDDTTFAGDGTAGFIFKGALSGSASLIKYGSSTVQLNGDSSSTFSGPINLRGGGIKVNVNLGGRLPTNQVVNFDGVSSTLSFGTSGYSMIGTVNCQRGSASILNSYSAGYLFTTNSARSRSTGATVNYSYAGGSVGTTTKIVLSGQPTGFIDGGSFVGPAFAYYDAAGYVRAMNYTTDTAVQNVNGDFTATSDIGNTTGAANKHTQITPAAGTATTANGAGSGTSLTLTDATNFQVGQTLSGTGIPKGTYITAKAGNTLTLSQANAVANAAAVTPYSGINNQSSVTLNTLSFASGKPGSLRLAAGQTLTLSDGGIITDGNIGTAWIISGGAGIQAGLNKELVVLGTANNNMLVIASPILANGVNALVRNGPVADINTCYLRLEGANTFTGGVYLNGNAIQLASAETPGVSGPLGVGGTIYFYGGQLFPTAINTYDYSPRFATTANQNFSVDSSGGSVTWAANLVSDNGTLTYKAAGGTGSLTLTGTNTYNGGTTITGNSLILGSDSALGTGPVAFNNASLPVVRNNSASATRTLRNALAINTILNLTFGVTDNSNIGSLAFTGPVTLGANVGLMAGSSGTTAGQTAVAFEGAIGDNGAGNTLTVPGTSSGVGAGFVFLLGTNTYSGQTTVGVGGGAATVVINSLGNAGVAGSLGAPAGANATVRVTAGAGTATQGTLRYVGGTTSTDRTIDMASTAGSVIGTLDASGSGPITFTSIAASGASGAANARRLYLTGVNTNANTISGSIPTGYNGNMKVEKNGIGTWVLTAANAFTNGLTVNAGRLVLDHANNAVVVNATNAITLGDTLEIKGNASSDTAPVLGNLTLNNVSLSKIILTRPGSAALGVSLGNTWAFGGAGFGCTLFIDLSSGATLACNPASQMNNGDIAYAVVKDSTGTGFAMTDGANIVRYTGGTALASNSSSTTANYTLSGNLTMATGSKNIYTLAVDTTGGGTLDLNGITLTANRSGTLAGGLLFTGAGNYTITNGIYAGAAGYYSFIHQYSTGIVTLASQAGASANSAQFLKDGSGTLVLGNKGSTGALRIFEGAVRADNANVLTSGAIQVNNGGVLELGAAGNFNGALGTSAGNIQFSGDGGFSAYGGTRTVQLNGGTATIVWGASNFVPDNNALVLGANDANDTLDFQNGLNLGNFQRVVDVKNGSAAVDGRLSGVLTSRYGGGLLKRGPGTLEVTGANDYQGETWVEGGELKVSSSTGSGLVTVGSGASISGTGTVNRLTLNSGGKLLVADATKPLNVTGAINITNGTLDLSSAGTLPAGDLTIVNSGSIIGSSFNSVVGLPAGRTVTVVGNTVVLKGNPAIKGTVILIK